MVHEINTLAKALIKNEKKYVKMQEVFKNKAKEYKKALRERDSDLSRQEADNRSLVEVTKQLKSNTEHLM
jgi:recombinational DNA repair ATPase RecF